MAVTSETQADTPPSPPAQSRSRGGGAGSLLKRFLTLREGSIIVVTLITIVYFAATTSNFLTGSNFKNLLPYFTFLAIMAAGQVFVMTLGEIDLSIGALWLFTPFVYWKLTEAGLPLVPAVIVALIVAMLLGAINGFFTAYIGIASFVATLAMLFFLDGLTLIISHSEEITTPGTSIVGRADVRAGLRCGHLLGADLGGRDRDRAAGRAVVQPLGYLHRRRGRKPARRGRGGHQRPARGGAQLRAVRGSPPASPGSSRRCGRRASRRIPSGSNTFLLEAISAVIIGGTLMTGGSGTVVGALIGALFLGVLNDGLVIKGVSANYVDLYLGIAIIIAMTVNVYIARVRLGSGRG